MTGKILLASLLLLPLLAGAAETTPETTPEMAPEMTPETASETIPATVNINTADAATLALIKGIGQAKARAIVSYREENGEFKSIDELADVRGIGPVIIEKNREFLTVE
ncbi:MAG: ComEA family DNA-binding protein [Gammaproteobacteria bacterium]|nr:ComEA family DNA-binding protein [Gammaproteobacteria bacterium]